jgi:hypothetical protein
MSARAARNATANSADGDVRSNGRAETWFTRGVWPSAAPSALSDDAFRVSIFPERHAAPADIAIEEIVEGRQTVPLW